MSKQIIFLDLSQWFIKDSELAQTQLLFTDALRKINETFESTNVKITLEKPSEEHSTIYITSSYDNSGDIIGIAQQDSIDNPNPNDVGMINFNKIKNIADELNLDLQQFSNLLANSISHEAGHLMGLDHSNDPNDIMHDGLTPNMWNDTMHFSDTQVEFINEMVNLTSSESMMDNDDNFQDSMIGPNLTSFDSDNLGDTDLDDQFDDHDSFNN